ncbi:Tryptase beta-2 [Balamuthia mandrillaris]
MKVVFLLLLVLTALLGLALAQEEQLVCLAKGSGMQCEDPVLTLEQVLKALPSELKPWVYEAGEGFLNVCAACSICPNSQQYYVKTTAEGGVQALQQEGWTVVAQPTEEQCNTKPFHFEDLFEEENDDDEDYDDDYGDDLEDDDNEGDDDDNDDYGDDLEDGFIDDPIVLAWMLIPRGLQCHEKQGLLQEDQVLDALNAKGIEVLAYEIVDLPVCEACGCPTSEHFRVLVRWTEQEVLLSEGWSLDEAVRQSETEAYTSSTAAPTFISVTAPLLASL